MFSKIKFLWVVSLLAGSANAAYFPSVAINNFNALGVYNLSPPTLTNGQTENLQLDASGNLRVTQSGTPALPTGASTAANQTNVQTAPGTSATTALTVQGASSGVALPISAASLPLPTGAATSANQTSGNTTLTTISGQLPTTLGAKTTANSMAVNIASDQTVPVSVASSKAPVNVTASGSAAAATVSTAATLTAPASAVGFVLQNLDTSTANIRWAIGRTAGATLGQQLQPGRDSGFIPCGANVTIIAESGTQNYDIQWVSQ